MHNTPPSSCGNSTVHWTPILQQSIGGRRPRDGSERGDIVVDYIGVETVTDMVAELGLLVRGEGLDAESEAD